MSLSEYLRKKATLRLKKIIFPESEDERIIAAAIEIKKLKIANPIILAKSQINSLDTIYENDEMLKNKAIDFLVEFKK